MPFMQLPQPLQALTVAFIVLLKAHIGHEFGPRGGYELRSRPQRVPHSSQRYSVPGLPALAVVWPWLRHPRHTHRGRGPGHSLWPCLSASAASPRGESSAPEAGPSAPGHAAARTRAGLHAADPG
eukprot:scaffold719_cov359-Prasinococcus_capsulatus_cf.AAC.2